MRVVSITWGRYRVDATINKENALMRKATVNPATFAYLRGSLLHAESHHDEALRQFVQAEGVQVHNRPSLYHKMGECYIAQRRWVEAEKAFERSLAVNPISGDPHLGLARCHLGRRRSGKALKAATTAVGLMYANPVGHFLCGRALQGLAGTTRRLQRTRLKASGLKPGTWD